ncbi:MAG: S8 family serine peptidase [Actinomycetota bacterium]
MPLSAAQGASAAPATTVLAPHVPGRILVTFTSTATAADRIDTINRQGSAQHRSLRTRGVNTELVALPTGTSVEQALAAYRADPNVSAAEPDYLLTRQAVPTDPYYLSGQQWSMYGDATAPRNAAGTGAAEAWTAGDTGSSTVVVGVVDEGIDDAHPDLAANIWTNPGETGTDTGGNDKATNGIDDDANGFIDDVNGWDFLNGDNTVYDGIDTSTTPPTLDLDIDAHGTHVAGTIGAKGGNAAGVAGVNWDVQMVSAKFLDPTFGAASDAISAINYLVDLKVNRGINLVAINNSWGLVGTEAPGTITALNAAIEAAGAAGILFVVAAGNSSHDHDGTANRYPSDYQCTGGGSRSWDCVISVAATDTFGNLAGYSDYGATSVDLGAPGSGIVSTLPNSRYGAMSGTSMAAPHVTGAIALCKSIDPSLSASAIRSIIMGTTTSAASLTGTTVTGGRLDIGSMAITCHTGIIATQPGRSTAPTATVGDRSMTVSWVAPASNGSAITDYTVTRATGPVGPFTPVTSGTCATHPLTTTSCTATGLTPGVRYWFQVSATNSIGTGRASPTSLARRAIGTPAAPATISSLGSRVVGKRTFKWTTAASNGSVVLRYEYRWKAHSAATFGAWTSTLLKKSVILTGLTKGVAYDIEVRAVNALGNGASAAATITH